MKRCFSFHIPEKICHIQLYQQTERKRVIMATHNIADQVGQEIMEKIRRFLNDLQTSSDRRKRLLMMQEQLEISKWEAEKRVENLAKLAQNPNKPPLIATYQASDQKLYEYTIKKLDEYNQSPEGEVNPITYVPSEDSAHHSVILTDEAGLEKLNEIKYKYAIEIGGYVSEIPLEKFNELSDKNNVTIISGVTEDQFNYINSRTWGDKNNFSYSACKQSDGTYKIAVLSKDYIGKVNKLTKEDMFAALVCEKMCNNPNAIAVNREEHRIEELVKKCDNDKPIYIASARNKGIYLKLEKNQIIMYGEGEPRVIQKTPENDKEFKVSALMWLSRIAEPMEINPEDKRIQAMLKEKNISLETLLKDHSKTGNENDFKVKDSDGKLQFLRPLTEPATEKSKAIEDFSSMLATEVGIRGTNALSKATLEPYIAAFENVMTSKNIPADKRDEILKKFTENVVKDFNEFNAPALKQYKQKELVMYNVKKAMTSADYVTNQDIKLRESCEEGMLKEIDKIKEEDMPDKVSILSKEANNLVQMVLVNDGDLSNGLKKLISSSQIPLNELPIVEIISACNEVIHQTEIETIYKTTEINLLEVMNYSSPDLREVDIKATAELASQSGQTVKSESISSIERSDR